MGSREPGRSENIVVDSSSTGYRLLPGQVLASLIRNATIELGIGGVVLTAVLENGVTTLIAPIVVSRRDVTA